MLSLAQAPDREPGSARSQATFAYEAIRGDIVAGLHAPDKKLKILDLATELGVSPGAVREALSRLVPEQLVVSRDQRGFAVAPLSIADLEDLTDLRCEVEAIALRRSVERGDVEWETGLVAAAHRLRVTPILAAGKTRVNPDWVAAHAGFHTALVSACGSNRLLALHAQLYEQSERYRGMTAQIEPDRDVEAEHREIVDLALSRDTEALVDSIVKHIRTTTDLIVAGARREAATVNND